MERVLTVIVPRLQRIEELLFETTEHRPNLESILQRVDAYLTVASDCFKFVLSLPIGWAMYELATKVLSRI